MREEASFRMFFEKFKVSKRKLEIDDPKPPTKREVLSHYEKGGTPLYLYLQFRSGTTTKLLSQQKYYIETLQAIEILLSKALREEDFGHEL